MGEGNETMTTTDTTTTCSHCGREIGVTCGTDVATYVNGLPYCGEDAPESESTLWLGRGSALAQAVRKQLGPIPSIALTAAVMGVTPKTIHNWIRKGSLRTTKPAGGKVYVDAESVIDFLERGRR